METVTIKKRINWEELLGANPIIKNRKITGFFDELEKESFLTRSIKLKIADKEYIMYQNLSNEFEEIIIKSNRAVLILSLKYDKKKKKVTKKVNYEFAEVIVYFLVTFFEERLKNDKEFRAIMEYLKKYETISLDISETAI